MEEVVAKRNICHKAWRKSKSAEEKQTLDVAQKEVYAAALAAQEYKGKGDPLVCGLYRAIIKLLSSR